MLLCACWQTHEEHRLERFFCLLLEICFLPRCWWCWQLSNISPFLPAPLFWQTSDLPNIRVHSVSAIFCAPYFLALSVWLYGFSIDNQHRGHLAFGLFPEERRIAVRVAAEGAREQQRLNVGDKPPHMIFSLRRGAISLRLRFCHAVRNYLRPAC